ncbi:hypothetical protein [Thioclava sp.]|uniref:hypothetical protein n=1 Tax=Thioclava sp. TaxID=1933450 RepID=UPI003242F1B8
MADLYPVAGAKIHIGGVTATQSTDFAESDFTGETWTEIDGWETMGSAGDSAEIISTKLINRGRVVKQKGTRDAGDMQNNFAIIPSDAGQTALLAAEKTTDNYAFKIVYDDMPSGGTSATTQYFVGLVTGAQEQGGGADTVRMLQSTIAINSNIVTVAAA